MGMLLGCGSGLLAWQGRWVTLDCPLDRVDLVTRAGEELAAVDNAAHQLWQGGRVLPCDRSIEALYLWNDHALLLSSDTDCLSLADADGWVRTARVGVYPQDMAIQGDHVWLCGGANGRLHQLHLPDLRETALCPLPGMAERIALVGDTAWLLVLLTDPDVCTALIHLDLSTGHHQEVLRLPGLPGALAADDDGLWLGVSEQVLHLPHGATTPDWVIEGFGLPRHIRGREGSVLITDPTEGLCALIRHQDVPGVQVLYRGDVGQGQL